MNFKSKLILCLLLVSGLAWAQSSETMGNAVTTNQNTALPSGGNSLQLASGAVLYDNGPLVNSPGTGVGGLDESVLQGNLGMTTLGFGHQLANSNRIADDFVVPAGGWTINQIEFFAYQSFETASTITAVNLQIWDGPPGQTGSNVVFGDTSTNRMTQTAPANILRVTDSTTGGNTDRQIAVSVVDVYTTLPAGTYWLDWQSDGSGGSGPWAPPITITGSTTTGNGLQSTDGGVTYANADDGGTLTQQGFPFIIYGPQPEAAPVPTMTILGVMGLMLLLVFFGRKYIRQ